MDAAADSNSASCFDCDERALKNADLDLNCVECFRRYSTVNILGSDDMH